MRKVGRPNIDHNLSEKLLLCARDLFANMPYEKVSIRMIANKAEVNSSMIGYYFGNKEGLFEAMFLYTTEPIYKKMQELAKNPTGESLIELISKMSDEFLKAPMIPRLLTQAMNMPPSDSKRKLVERLMEEFSKPLRDMVFSQLIENGVIRDDMDPQLCRFSWVSLVMFPFLIPSGAYEISKGIDQSEEFYKKLMEHNIKLMTHGFIKTNPSGED
ncbi:TetR/AcrR family transcriptional regulator [Vibrio marisflavi]|nr:TetR/AcrR family transcriptional regulator [Vibrio marisflavi]